MGSTIVLGWKKKCNITIVHHSPYLVQFILQLCNPQTSSSKFKEPPYNPSQLQVTQLFWILITLLTSILKTHHIHSIERCNTMGKRSQPYSFNRQETMNFLPALIKILYWVSSLVKLIIRARRDFLQAFGSNSFCIFPSHCELRRIPEPCQEFHYQTEIRVLHKPYNWTDMYWFKFHSHYLHACILFLF
jgi:hypothetical protein